MVEDLKVACRRLRHSPRFTFAILLTLATRSFSCRKRRSQSPTEGICVVRVICGFELCEVLSSVA